MKNSRSFFLVSLCLLLGTLWIATGCEPEEETASPERKIVAVQVSEVKAEALSVVVEAVGRLSADREVNLSVEVGGVVSVLRVDVGDPVQSGQVLLELDPADYILSLRETQANLKAAQARLEMAVKSHKRAQELWPRQIISKNDYEQSESEFKAAQADVARIEALVDVTRRRLEKTRLTAPFSGVIAARLVEKGQSVGLGQFMGQPIITLVDLNPMRVKVSLAENHIVQVDKDDPVTVSVEAFPNKTFTGRIDVIGVKADPMTNTFPVEVLVDNPDLSLKAGFSARVQLRTSVHERSLLIPQSAVLYRQDHEEVFVVEDGRARVRPIKVGSSSGGRVRILSGLAPGDRLVVSGGQYIQDGDPVRVTASGDASNP